MHPALKQLLPHAALLLPLLSPLPLSARTGVNLTSIETSAAGPAQAAEDFYARAAGVAAIPEPAAYAAALGAATLAAVLIRQRHAARYSR